MGLVMGRYGFTGGFRSGVGMHGFRDGNAWVSGLG